MRSCDARRPAEFSLFFYLWTSVFKILDSVDDEQSVMLYQDMGGVECGNSHDCLLLYPQQHETVHNEGKTSYVLNF